MRRDIVADSASAQSRPASPAGSRPHPPAALSAKTRETLAAPLDPDRQMSYFDNRSLSYSDTDRSKEPTERTMPKRMLKERIRMRIARKKGNVFLREDFMDLGGYDQVGRALGALVREGQLLKFGYGIYARAQISPFDGKPAPTIGVKRLAEEALRRLKVETAPPRLEREYNAGATTQVPTGRVIGVRKRVRRQLGYADVRVSLERIA